MNDLREVLRSKKAFYMSYASSMTRRHERRGAVSCGSLRDFFAVLFFLFIACCCYRPTMVIVMIAMVVTMTMMMMTIYT